MINYPKITVITPSYNQGAFIEDTILSVINQNYPNLEYIIIDGGSTDNTVDVIKKYSDKITYWISESDTGQSNAINKALKIATGDLINWINSDDQLEEKALFDIADLYLKNPNCSLFIGQTVFYSDKMNYGKGGKILFQNREITFAFGQVNQPAMFYKMEAIKKMGFVNEKLHYCMDIDWWLKFLLHFNLQDIAQTDTVWAKFRLHDESKTINNPEDFKIEKNQIYKSIFSFYQLEKQDSNTSIDIRLYPEKTSLNIQSAYNYYKLWRSDELCLEKKKKEAFRYWLRVNPFKIIGTEKRRYLAIFKNLLFN